MAMAESRNIEFGVEGGVTLRGWLFVPNAKGPAPAITMAHGYAGVKEHGIERFARAFTEVGFVVLVHDHRNFGASDGAERGDVDPWQQIADWRRAISFLESQPEVDVAQIGLWGTSYAGDHAIVLGATDRRPQIRSPAKEKSLPSKSAMALPTNPPGGFKCIPRRIVD
jgi:dienelactone hydrolase